MEQNFSDEEIVRCVQEGNRAMFTILVNRYSKKMLNYIYRLTGRSEDAEDILQELFIRLYRNITKFDCTRSFKPWLYKIAGNLCYSQHAKKSKRKEVSLNKSYIDCDSGSSPELLDAIPDTKFDPEEMALNKELIESVEQKVAELNPKLKEVFVLFHFQNFSYNEIADTVAIPVGTVKSRLHNACRQLFFNLKREAAK